MYNEKDIYEAHKYGIYNREHIEKSFKCGCFYCTKIFSSSEIDFWIDNNDTAMCPYCCTDSVIGDYSGYPITEDFLDAMKKRWF